MNDTPTGDSPFYPNFLGSRLAANKMELKESIYNDVQDLCETGDTLASEGKYQESLKSYLRAWSLLPEPKEDWDAATWILAAIGDAHYFLKDYKNAHSVLTNAMRCANGLGNPFIHLRLGEASLELGMPDQAKEELARAYMGGGKGIFDSEEPKYFAFLKSFLLPSP